VNASNMRPSEEEAWVKMAKSGELARFLGTEVADQYQARLDALARQIEREKREAGRTNP